MGRLLSKGQQKNFVIFNYEHIRMICASVIYD